MPSDALSAPLPLAHLQEDATGRIRAVSADARTVGLLEGLGICEGRMVRLVRKGEPCIVSVYGRQVGLAGSLADGILLEMP